MTELPDIPFARRPSWAPPSVIGALATSLGLVLGLLGVLEEDRLPPGVGTAALAVALLTTSLLGMWVLSRVALEILTAIRRLLTFRKVYTSAVTTHTRVNELSRELAMHATSPESARTIAYEFADCVLANDLRTVHVTLDETEKPALAPGMRLRVVDRVDGQVLGTLEVTGERAVTGQFLVAVTAGDAVFLGFVHRHAQERTKPTDSRAQAIRTTLGEKEHD